MRAIVCLWIAAVHFFPHALDRWPEGYEAWPQPRWLFWRIRFGYESFFVIAGYFLAYSFRDPKSYLSIRSFLLRRLLRLAIPYWVALLVVGVGGYALSAAIRGGDSLMPLSSAWPSIFFVQDFFPHLGRINALWFMAPLMQFYVIWGLSFWFVRRQRLGAKAYDHHRDTLCFMIGFMAVAFVASTANVALSSSHLWHLARDAHFIALGCLTYWVASGILRPKWLLVAGCVEIALAFCVDSFRPLAAMILAGLLLLTVGRSVKTGPSTRWLEAVGLWSYSIYLTHEFVGFRVMKIVNVALDGQPILVVSFASWAAAILVSVAFAAGFYAVVERPLKRFNNDIAYRE